MQWWKHMARDVSKLLTCSLLLLAIRRVKLARVDQAAGSVLVKLLDETSSTCRRDRDPRADGNSPDRRFLLTSNTCTTAQHVNDKRSCSFALGSFTNRSTSSSSIALLYSSINHSSARSSNTFTCICCASCGCIAEHTCITKQHCLLS
jgi:hypothetical protein